MILTDSRGEILGEILIDFVQDNNHNIVGVLYRFNEE